MIFKKFTRESNISMSTEFVDTSFVFIYFLLRVVISNIFEEEIPFNKNRLKKKDAI